MQTYEIVVKERSVRRNSKDMTLVRTSIGIDQVHILFDNEEWLDFPITCTFAQDEDVITIPLTVVRLHGSDWVAEATVTVPYEVIDMNGPIRVTLQGTDSDGRHIITAKGSPLFVEEAGDVLEGDAPSEYPTVDQWQQAFADAQELMNEVASAMGDIDERIADAIRDAVDSLDLPEQYVLPTATDEVLGGVKIGSGISYLDDGTIFVTQSNSNSRPSVDINEFNSLVRALDDLTAVVNMTIGAEYDDGELVSTSVRPPSVPPATLDAIGGIILDGTTIWVDDDGMAHAGTSNVPPATATYDSLGVVRPDGTTITIDEDGVIHSVGGGGSQIIEETPIATTEVAGKVKPDGTTITIDEDGTIHGAMQVDLPDEGPHWSLVERGDDVVLAIVIPNDSNVVTPDDLDPTDSALFYVDDGVLSMSLSRQAITFGHRIVIEDDVIGYPFTQVDDYVLAVDSY